MLLQRLVEYSSRIEDIAPPGYSKKAIRYVIELDRDGNLRNPTPIDLSTPKNKRGEDRIAPNVVRSVGIKPLLLADNAEYTLNLPRDESKASRAEECHGAFMELLTRCKEKTGEKSVDAIYRFLNSSPLQHLILPDEFERGDCITFRVDGEFPIELRSVQQFWALYISPEQGQILQCLICGEERPTMESLQGKIKGIPGGQTSGTSLISANADAFESFGLKRSYIAPVCEECADRFTKALNDLLSDRSSCIRLNGLAFTFWTREEVGFDFLEWMDTPSPEKVRALFESIHNGRRPSEIDDVAFYALSLSASGARAVVRDYVDTTIGNVKTSLHQWFARQAIVDGWGETGAPLGVYKLASATVREMKDLATPTSQSLFRAALAGTPLPMNLLQKALQRNAAEHDVTYPRAALIKLVLASHLIIQEDEMMELQMDRPEPAYHCGRLLSVLEQVQQAALGKSINTTIVDRFYGTASTAPAVVFGTLLGGAQPHLSKLRRSQRENVAYALQTRLEEVLAKLPAFPRTLTLQDQALFALGYYHQRAYDRAQAKLKKNNAQNKTNP